VKFLVLLTNSGIGERNGADLIACSSGNAPKLFLDRLIQNTPNYQKNRKPGDR